MSPTIIASAGPMLARYDVLFCDVWGVVHNGYAAFTGACAALEKFRENGGTVILVSNAPVPKAQVARMLDSRHVPRTAWDDIVCSGDLALREFAAKGYRSYFGIGPQDRDQALFRAISAQHVGLTEADAILCTGLNDDVREKPGDYRPVLEQALARGLPFVCANPDLVVDVGGELYYCAGAIADIYERMGGSVCWAGKPFALAYATARAIAEDLRGGAVEKSRILVIGDSLRTDINGAVNFGVDSVFVASGIHRTQVMEDNALVPEAVEALFAGDDTPKATAAIAELVW